MVPVVTHQTLFSASTIDLGAWHKITYYIKNVDGNTDVKFYNRNRKLGATQTLVLENFLDSSQKRHVFGANLNDDYFDYFLGNIAEATAVSDTDVEELTLEGRRLQDGLICIGLDQTDTDFCISSCENDEYTLDTDDSCY